MIPFRVNGKKSHILCLATDRILRGTYTPCANYTFVVAIKFPDKSTLKESNLGESLFQLTF